MELEDLRDAMSELSYDDVEFFAHLTEKENGNSICDNGLCIDDNKLSSCVNPILDSFYEDPNHYIDFELGSPQTRAKEIMVLIGCEKDSENRLIRKNNKLIINIHFKTRQFRTCHHVLFFIDKIRLYVIPILT